MFLFNMTCEEFSEEMAKDKPNVYMFIYRFFTDGKRAKAYRRQGARFPVTFKFTFTTKRNNTYICSCTFKNRSALINPSATNDSIYHFLPIVRGPEGKDYLLMFHETKHFVTGASNRTIFLLSPHLLSRYAERMGLQDLNRTDIITTFMCNNTGFVQARGFRVNNSELINPDDTMFVCNDGAIFCKYDDDKNIFIGKTFIDTASMEGTYKQQFNDIFDDAVSRIKDDVQLFKPLIIDKEDISRVDNMKLRNG